jgi:acetyl esterase/lipase
VGVARKKIKKLFGLDYTTALITATVVLLMVSLSIALTGSVQRIFYDKDDFKKPLKITNLTYCNGEKLDLTVPHSDTSVPLVIYVHGGGWQYGSKVGGSLALASPLVRHGFAVASINYRLSGKRQFPAQVQDVFCAVRYLRANATQYNLNKERVGIIGLSAGANLSILAANASDQPSFTAGAYQEQSSRVQAAVGVSGIYDLTDPGLNKSTKSNIQKLTGGDAALRAQASPQHFVSADDAKQLLIYGANDKQVSNSQTFNYTGAALKAGINVESLKVGNADHNLNPYLRLSTNPNRGQVIDEITTFFAKNL